MKPFTSPESPFISPNTQVSRSDTRRYLIADQAGKILSVDNGSGSGAAGTSGDIPTPPTVEELLRMSDAELTQYGYIRTGDGIISMREQSRREEAQRQRENEQRENEQRIQEQERQIRVHLSFLENPEILKELIGLIFVGGACPIGKTDTVITSSFEIYDERAIDINCTLQNGDKLFLSLGNEYLDAFSEINGSQDEKLAKISQLDPKIVHYAMKLDPKDQQYLKDFGEFEAPHAGNDESGFVDDERGEKYEYYELRVEGDAINTDQDNPSFPNRTNCQREVQEFIDRLKGFDDEDEDGES